MRLFSEWEITRTASVRFEDVSCDNERIKVVKHIELPCPKKSICHFQKLEMILK